ncbi:alpha-2-macroglobulin family protein [Thiothrix nivea]|uniref:Alpha-2-macroglobulin n=1 Tax=Thiothrix nivea (strain ATCC 35100 / DSM 5205 / JP2) TaxID=870187 RepID=A0A656HB19_THINJ|nr:alpha-2-macroglobulin [Thiothrix nivea]EIJ33282.1 alpha-2-macroglobulin domain protein [Thiothrix nivea DSM 5205]
MGFHVRRLVPPIWFVCLLACLLLGISAGATEDAASPPEATPKTAEPAALPGYTNEELLTQMLVVDVSERSLDTSPALAITFSQDLRSTEDYNSFITLTAGGKMVEGSWVLASETRRLFFSNIKPQTEYRIQVRPGVASKNDLKLQKPVDYTVKTRDVKPAFDFATTGSILPAKLTGGLPIRVVNVPELDIEFLRVQPDKLPEMLQTVSLGERLSQWQLEDIHRVTESVHAQRYVTDAKPNARTSLLIPVENIPELKTPGLYFAVMREPGRFSDDAYRITQFIVTNIGLHVRLYPRGLEVFTNALDSGKPLSGVQLKLRGEKETLSLAADERGHVSFVHRPQGGLLLTAQVGNQFAFLDLRDAALDLSEYQVEGLPDKPIAPFVYSSRDLFRPGENMDLSILLRNRDGQPVPGKNLHLRIVRPDTKLLLEENLVATNPALGYFSWRLPIPADAPTGSWKAELRINAKDESPVNTFTFHVEEFMPERMKLALSTEDKLLTSGETLIVAAQGDYLYGAPASGNKLTAVRTVSVNQHPLDSFKDYYFGDPADNKLVSREDLPELVLNETGGGFLEIPPLAGKINSPLTLSVVGELHETGGRGVVRKLDVPFWPTQNLVGIRPLFSKDTVAGNGEAAFELARVNAEGQPVPAAQPLAVTLVREEKEYFWEYNDAEGWRRKEISSEYPTVQQKVTLDAEARGKVVFSVQYGYYRLEVEDAETGLKAVYPFHAGWDWEQSENTAARPDQIELALDKPMYKAGDIAKLTITPPAAGEAIVAVEGESMLWSERVSLSAEGTTVDIQLDKAWNRHDLYATVTAFRPASSQQKIAPNRALGVIFLPLDREDRRLNLSIEAPEKVLPEKTVSVTVSSDNLSNESAIVTLAAVDAGVLSITDFKTPDPFAFFFSQHKYEVNLYDDYGKIIEGAEGTPLRQRFGGDAGIRRGGSLAQADVKIVSLFSGAVNFDADGKAKIDLPLPGFDGTLRLMAIAASSQRFGSAEQEMKVASPVVASLAAPRFLAVGDSGFLTVDINNTTTEAQTVTLKIDANPLLAGLALERELTLAAGKRETLRLPLAAQQSLGLAQVNLELTGKDFVSHRQLQFAVRPAYPAKHLGLSRELKPGETLALNAANLQGFLSAGLDANLSLAATPPLPLRSALQGLLQYPYGCLEQTTSSAWPYLFLDANVTEQLGLEPVNMKTRNERVSAALLRLGGMQLSNGGFTLWGNYGAEEYWLTPYVADFLLDAKEQGFTVPEWLLQRTLQNLEERMQEGERYVESRYEFSDTPDHLDLAARAYAAYVLSRVKRASPGTLKVMFDKDAGKAASGLPLVHLGLALRASGDPKRGDEAIKRGLALARDEQKYLGDYGSSLRDRAAMLYLLLRYQVSIPQQAAEITKLADLLHNRSYFSTQEQLFTLLAGLKVEEKLKAGWQAALKIGDGSVDLPGKGVHYQSLAAMDFQKGISIATQGQEPLYVALSLDGYPDVAPAPDSDPVMIQRDWYGMDGKLLQTGDIKPGSLLLTHLALESAVEINDALVVDLLPAGFEIENTNLQTNESLEGLQLEGMDKPVMELMGSSSLRTQEFRDDRYLAALPLEAKTRHHLFYMVRVVSSGKFRVPPPYAEDMYRPELNGVGVVTPGQLDIP